MLEEDMLCPFCFSLDIDYIYEAKVENSDESRLLHKCNQCGSFFWHDTGEKVRLLLNLCNTRRFNREKCNEKILNFFPKQGTTLPNKKRIKELDKICIECPNKKFILRRHK